MTGRLMHLGYSLAVPLLVLLAWQLSAQAGWVSAIVLPAPTAIFRAIFEGLRSGELLQDATDRKSTRLNSSHIQKSRMPSSA